MSETATEIRTGNIATEKKGLSEPVKEHTNGKHKLEVFLPLVSVGGGKEHSMYRKGGDLPKVEPMGADGFAVTLEQGRKDVEFVFNPNTKIKVHLIGEDGKKLASVVTLESGVKEGKVRASGERGRWLTVAQAERVTAHGYEAGTDDDIRIVIPQKGFVRDVYLNGNAAAETPNAGNPRTSIGEIHPSGAENWLNNTRLKPGETLAAFMVRLPHVRQEDIRRAVPPDELHPKTLDKMKREEAERQKKEDKETAVAKLLADSAQIDIAEFKAAESLPVQARSGFIFPDFVNFFAQFIRLRNQAFPQEGNSAWTEQKPRTRKPVLVPTPVENMLFLTSEIRDSIRNAGVALGADKTKVVDVLVRVATATDKPRRKGTVNMLSPEAIKLLAVETHDTYPISPLYPMITEMKHDKSLLEEIVRDPVKVARVRIMLLEIDKLLNPLRYRNDIAGLHHGIIGTRPVSPDRSPNRSDHPRPSKRGAHWYKHEGGHPRVRKVTYEDPEEVSV